MDLFVAFEGATIRHADQGAPMTAPNGTSVGPPGRKAYPSKDHSVSESPFKIGLMTSWIVQTGQAQNRVEGLFRISFGLIVRTWTVRWGSWGTSQQACAALAPPKRMGRTSTKLEKFTRNFLMLNIAPRMQKGGRKASQASYS